MTMVVDGGQHAAPTVVLVHGVGLDHHMWDGVTAELAAGYRVVRYDLVGHGISAAHPGEVTLDTFVDQLFQVVNAAQLDSFVLVGFSLGALITQAFASRFPDRVAALVLANGVFDRSPDERDAVLARVDEVLAGGYADSIETALDRWFSASFATSHPDVVETVRLRLQRNDIASYIQAYRVFATASEPLVLTAPMLSAPTLVVTGADDSRSTPAMARALAAAIQHGQAAVLPGLRHLAPVEDPATVARLIVRFLESLGLGSDPPCQERE